MFEPPQEKEAANSKLLWISISLAVVLIVMGTLGYMASRRGAKGPASAAAPAAAAARGEADPIKDIKIFRATMDKDRSGTVAVWVINIQNKSAVFTYSNIEYETTYIGADNRPLLVNKGTIPVTLGPGDQDQRELRDALYPTGTAWYKFRVTGAKSSIR